jgi:hypothetical protein
MSDLLKIVAEKKATRLRTEFSPQRQIMALEDIADSVEGIRQDLTALNIQLAALAKALAQK